jgi:hypothetical protein
MCLSTGPVGQGGHLPANFCYDGFLLMWCICKFDIMIELTACVGLPGLHSSGSK